MLARKILKVGNSRALILDKTISAALGIESDTTEIPVTIEDGRVILTSATTQDPFEALRKKLARYPEAEARKMAAAEVAAVRPKTIRRWKAASRKVG